MKSQRIKHDGRGFATHMNEGHDGKPPAPTRKLRRKKGRGSKPRVKPPCEEGRGTGPGTSCKAMEAGRIHH